MNEPHPHDLFLAAWNAWERKRDQIHARYVDGRIDKTEWDRQLAELGPSPARGDAK